MSKIYTHIFACLMITLNITWSQGQVISLSGQWKFKIGDDRSWSRSTLDDNKWAKIKVPGNWEDQGYHGYDGYAWYRINFDGTTLKRGVPYYLSLGYIDDVDEVYFNGQLIGFSGGFPPHFYTAYQAERKYILPESAVNYSGTNTIAVRVFDAQLQGGILDGKIGLYRYYSSSPILIDLEGVWEFTVIDQGKPVTKEHWNRIMVPSFWEKQGYRRYDGYAWYRKQFIADASLLNEELILLLGRIDDFDEVFINGKLIGRTRDNRPFGESHSWQQHRAYEIPPNVLIPNRENVIEVLVEDMGLDGGIYEGPIGITSRDLYNQFFKRR